MSSLTIITGTIEDARDPFDRLDLNELYYEFWEEDPDDLGTIIKSRDRAPIVSKGFDKFDIVQTMGCGKTLKAMDILANKAYSGGTVLANLGLIWNNMDRDEKNWEAGVNSFDDLWELNHCTVLFDDFSILVPSWNTEEANTISPIVNNSGKAGLDIIITAQQEVQVPPKIRRVATDWIVPIIRVRDFRQPTPRNDGYPIEMICLYFDGTKVLKYISEPMIGLEPLFKAYRTVERAGNLSGAGGARTNQPGYELEAKAFEYLKTNVPGMEWQHLNGKNVFDIISETHAFDIVGTDPDGGLVLDHKDLAKHMRTAKRLGQKPYLMFLRAKEWKFIQITPNLNALVEGKRINPDKIANNRFKILEKCIG